MLESNTELSVHLHLPPLLACLLTTAACIGDPPGLTKQQETQLAQYILAEAPADLTKIDVDFGGKVHVVGYAVEPKQAAYPPGTNVKVTLVWRCDEGLSSGWQLFTHLVGQGGQKLEN